MNEDIIKKWNDGEWDKLKRLDLITLIHYYEDLWHDCLLKVNNHYVRLKENDGA